MGSLAVAAASTLSSLHHLTSSLHSLRLPPLRSLSRVSCSLSSPSSSLQFNFSFAPPNPKSKPKPTESDPPISLSDLSGPNGQLFIPWIVRGEDGNLKLQTHPPARLLHAMAHAETKNKKTTNKKDSVVKREPKFSKASRRFYNENFRDSEQRLSKVLASSGGNFNYTLCILFGNAIFYFKEKRESEKNLIWN